MTFKACFITSLLLSCLALPALAAEFQGKVIRVLDGDTVEVLHDQKPERIRLSGIDCPEKSQAFGQSAKQLTSSLCFGKVITVQDLGRDRYGRTIGELTCQEKNINHELVKAGLAWWYSKYAPHDTVLQKLEEEAKQKRLGLWADDNPTPPWEYRHSSRTRRLQH